VRRRVLLRWRVVLAMLTVMLLAACSITRGSGQITSESRQVSGFSKVELSGSGELTIEQTGTESLTISAEENLLPKLTSEVSDDTLVLRSTSNAKIIPTQPIKYSLTVKDLSGLAVSGSGSVTMSKLATAALSTNISGSGAVTASGTADQQDLKISGSGRYQAEQLTSKTVKVDMSGSGVASVHASDALDLHMSGSGTLTYTGDPKQVTQQISGSGKVIKK
jgi:Putative auto-transporter adhesin, head GIN domain